MALTTLAVRWKPNFFWTLVADQEPASTLAVRWTPRAKWNFVESAHVVNRVYDSVASKHVTWRTLHPDVAGTSYPGPGVFGVTTSDYCIERIPT